MRRRGGRGPVLPPKSLVPSMGLMPILPVAPNLLQFPTHVPMLAFDPPHSPLTLWYCAARPEGGSGRGGRRAERGSPSRSNEVISPEILKMRAALFCIFTYLDTRTLLHAAEVCRDWRFVARHPAVWTRVLLENARICSKVLPPPTTPSLPPIPSERTFPPAESGAPQGLVFAAP